jgi:hypothetical protein
MLGEAPASSGAARLRDMRSATGGCDEHRFGETVFGRPVAFARRRCEDIMAYLLPSFIQNASIS